MMLFGIDEAIGVMHLWLLRRLAGAPASFPQVDTIDFFNGRTPPLDVKSDTPTWGNSLGELTRSSPIYNRLALMGCL
jgi:hypothetical protein